MKSSYCTKSTIVGAFVALSLAAWTCSGVSILGKPVKFGHQTNIVIWNPATHIEHFVRDAHFNSEAKDFGFIAPTPTNPEISEASEDAFVLLAALKPPDRNHEAAKAAAASTDAAPAPRVVQDVHVAGYHAVTLLASDSAGLATWMKQHGYATTPAIQKWTDFYVKKHWYLTAFKVENRDEVLATGTIRLTFKTDKPFNPYYVPSDNIPQIHHRTGGLSLYFISSETYDGHVGEAGEWVKQEWASGISEGMKREIATDLKLDPSELPAGARVQFFHDRSFPRDAKDDLYFTLSPVQPQDNARQMRVLQIFGFVLITGLAFWRWISIKPKA